MKLLIKRFFVDARPKKQKYSIFHSKNKNTVYFIVNIAIFESLLSKGIHVNIFKLPKHSNFEVAFLVIWFISYLGTF